MKTILRNSVPWSSSEADAGPDGIAAEPDSVWDPAGAFGMPAASAGPSNPAVSAGPFNVGGSFVPALFIGAVPNEPEPLGPNPGPISPTDVSWISGTDGGVVLTSANGNNPSISSSTVPAGSGFHINLLYDAAAMAAPQSFRDGIQSAMNMLSAAISDNITVNIKIDYSGTGGGASAGPDHGTFLPYSTVRSTLLANATPGDTSFSSLPNTTSIQNQSSVAVWNAQLKLFGQIAANDTTTDDGSAFFSTDINPNLLPGVALHELTHALGRIPYGSAPDIFDLFRFTSLGTRLFSSGSTAPAAYFSLDGGATKIADYGRNSDPSDFLNSGVQGSTDPFNEFYSSNTLQQLTAIDLEQLDVLGFHLTSASPVVIESAGSTTLVQAGSNYFLDPLGGGTGPELKYNGANVTAGEFADWSPIGAEKAGAGYDVVWKEAGVDQYTAWATDSNGNFTASLMGWVSGSSYALESLEPILHQDLNGDGFTGITNATVESSGSTRLVDVSNNFFMNPVGGGTGPELKYNGSPVVAGGFGDWLPIAAEQAGAGYDVVWKETGADQYTAWSTDSSGNFTASVMGWVSGSSYALESLEPILHQDLNGDGFTGVANATVESSGSTSLVDLNNNFFMNPVGGGTGPELKYNGSPVLAGGFGDWLPIAAEKTASGYDVAWKEMGADQYTAWTTDSNGNFTSSLMGWVSGSSSALTSLEPIFHQDLNGNGVIG